MYILVSALLFFSMQIKSVSIAHIDSSRILRIFGPQAN